MRRPKVRVCPEVGLSTCMRRIQLPASSNFMLARYTVGLFRVIHRDDFEDRLPDALAVDHLPAFSDYQYPRVCNRLARGRESSA